MTSTATIATGSPGTRRWRRFQIAMPLRVTIEKCRQVSVIHSRSSQVNAGGLCFFVEPDLFAETDLAVGDGTEITLLDYGLTLRAVVRNRAGDHCGVKFLAASAEEAEHLGRFRQMLSAKAGPLYS